MSQSNADLLFAEITSASDKAAYLQGMINSTPPTFEEEWLDFKSGTDGPKSAMQPLSDVKIQEIWSTALSGFANTGGGVLIWGIDARPVPSSTGAKGKVDAACDERLVPNPDALKSQLMRLHHQATDPPVIGVRIEPVAAASGGGFVVCLIPESVIKPHRAERVANKPYYFRVGDDFVVAPVPMLRNMFYPRISPRYALQAVCQRRNGHLPAIATLDFKIDVSNIGTATAREPFIVFELDPSNFPPPQTIDNVAWQPVQVTKGVAFQSRSSIHPGSAAPMLRANFLTSQIDISKLIRLSMRCKIYSLDVEPQGFSCVFDITDITGVKTINALPVDLTPPSSPK